MSKFRDHNSKTKITTSFIFNPVKKRTSLICLKTNKIATFFCIYDVFAVSNINNNGNCNLESAKHWFASATVYAVGPTSVYYALRTKYTESIQKRSLAEI